MSFITDERVQASLDFLLESCDPAAEAKAHREYMKEFLKSKKALLMKEHANLPLGAQEREALASPEYLELLQAYKQSVFADVSYSYKRAANQALIESWRTMSATERSVRL